MKPRKLDLVSGRWRFIVGYTKITLWSPAGRRHVISNREVTPDTSKSWYCCDHCEWFEGAITPGNLRAFIENNLEHFGVVASQDT